jgi:glycosyltransferase involved in cell wall biosynthesis
MIKIAHITTVDMSLCYLLLDQLQSIRQAGYEVIGISSPGPNVCAIEAAGIRHIAVPMTRKLAPMADLLTLWRLYRVMKRERFTIVHTHNPKPGLLGQMAACLAGVPVVINTVHGFHFHENMPTIWRRFYITLEKIGALFSDVILSQNKEDIQVAIQEGICPPGRIKHLGNGINLQLFNPDQLGPESIEMKRRELGLIANSPVVGFVGRLAAKRKGFTDFLSAARQIVRQNGKVRFLIAGVPDRGKSDAVSPEIVNEYGIQENCIFLGWQPNDEMPLLYALMDVVVLPSLYEGIPRAIMEACAMCVPVVVTDVKGNREVVKHGLNGLIVPHGDRAALTNAISKLLHDRKKRQIMGYVGSRIALEHFDQTSVFERVKRTYIHLLRKGLLPVPKYKPTH